MKTGRFILYIILAGLVVGAIVGYQMWNKPHKKAEDADAITITTRALADAYSGDEAKANQLYLDKVLQVTGTVSQASTNQDGKPVIELDNGIQCTMRDAGANAVSGQQVTIKGFCTGNDMFGVLLNDCIIVN